MKICVFNLYPTPSLGSASALPVSEAAVKMCHTPSWQLRHCVWCVRGPASKGGAQISAHQYQKGSSHSVLLCRPSNTPCSRPWVRDWTLPMAANKLSQTLQGFMLLQSGPESTRCGKKASVELPNWQHRKKLQNKVSKRVDYINLNSNFMCIKHYMFNFISSLQTNINIFFS